MIGRVLGMALALGAAAMTPPAHAEMAPAEGGQLYYETCGSGPQAIVLVHDGLVHSAAFDEMWAILCRDFRVVRYDRRGYGKSPAAQEPYAQTDDLAAVLAAARVERASLVGFSAGGGVALDFALDRPAAVERLVLVGAAINGYPTSVHFLRRTSALLAPLSRGDIDAVIAGVAKDPWLVAAGQDAARARLVALLRANPQNIRSFMGVRPRTPPPTLPRLPGLKAPTLVLAGEHDIPEVHAMAGAVHALAPGSRRAVVAGAGHLLQLERPAETAALVADFIRGGR